MTGNISLLVIILGGIFALFSVGGAGTVVLQSWRSRQDRDDDREERAEERRKMAQEREKLGAEHDKISAEAAEVALRALRNELNAAYEDVEKRRRVIQVQDAHIEELGKTVREQAKRIVGLEDWAAVASRRLERLGIADMPAVPREINGSSDHG